MIIIFVYGGQPGEISNFIAAFWLVENSTSLIYLTITLLSEKGREMVK